MRAYYSVTNYGENRYAITSGEGVSVYLLVGSEKALVIDTGYGFANLREVVDGLAKRPLLVVNTHGHLDHVDGNFWFEDCPIYLHEKDWPAYEKYYLSKKRQEVVERGRRTRMGWGSDEVKDILPEDFDEEAYIAKKRPRVLPVREGDIFDLGGIRLVAYEVPGHTWGSIALLDEGTGALYIGDAANSHLVLCIDAATATVYRQTLQKLAALEFEVFMQGHGIEPVPKKELYSYIDCANHLTEEYCQEMISPVHGGIIEKVFTRPGYSFKEMEKPGFASLIAQDENLV